MIAPQILRAHQWERWGWVIESAEGRFGVNRADIVGRSHRQEHVDARRWVCECLWGSGLGFAQVGRLVGRGHQPVIKMLSQWRAR